MSFFVKVTHIGNRSKSDKSLSEKVTHKFCGDHENKPLTSNEKLVNSKRNKVETNDSILQHEVCDIGGSIADIFEQLHLSILHSFNLSFQ